MATLSRQNTIPRVPIIDALRALAIIWIASFHIWQISWLSHRIILFGKVFDFTFLPANGNLGVELFVFISGFGLFYAFTFNHFAGRPLPRFSSFFKRRALRIVPSYLLVLTISLIFFPENIHGFQNTLRSVLAHLFFVQNLFISTFDTILGVLWIIGVFVQFYLLFPLLSKAFFKRPLLTFLFLSAVSLAYRILITTLWLDRAFHLISQLPAFLDVFLFGMAAAYVVGYLQQHKAKLQQYKGFFTILAVCSALLFYFMLRYADKYRFVYTNVFIWQSINRFYFAGTFFLFTVTASFANNFFIKIFANRVTLFLAAISFHLFMWHQKIGRIIFDNQLLISATADQRKDGWWQFLFTVIVFWMAIRVSSLFYYGFEQPIARYGFTGAIKRLVLFFRKKTALQPDP